MLNEAYAVSVRAAARRCRRHARQALASAREWCERAEAAVANGDSWSERVARNQVAFLVSAAHSWRRSASRDAAFARQLECVP